MRARREGGIEREKQRKNAEERCKESRKGSTKQALKPHRIDRPRQAARGDPHGTRRFPA
ncbi:hypothetical protein PT2222_40164 [Paraburkholderia tropica]